jgi:16S rRNA processing protein RimM
LSSKSSKRSRRTAARRPTSPIPRDAVRLGTIAAAHGVGGAVKVRLDNPESTTLESVRRVFVAIDGTVREYAVERAEAPVKGFARVGLASVRDRTAAEALRGAEISVARAELPALRAGEFYHHEVLGCEVFVQGGGRLGALAEVVATGANDVWIVRADGREFLIPVIEDVVKSIDLDARRITIEPLPGLLD